MRLEWMFWILQNSYEITPKGKFLAPFVYMARSFVPNGHMTIAN